jgi:hypothetical protein
MPMIYQSIIGPNITIAIFVKSKAKRREIPRLVSLSTLCTRITTNCVTITKSLTMSARSVTVSTLPFQILLNLLLITFQFTGSNVLCSWISDTRMTKRKRNRMTTSKDSNTRSSRRKKQRSNNRKRSPTLIKTTMGTLKMIWIHLQEVPHLLMPKSSRIRKSS